MIWKLIPLLAQSSSAPMTADDLRAAAPPTKLPGYHINDMLTVIAATMLVVALVVIWAVFIRKPGSGGNRSRVYKSRPREEETEDGLIRKRKRHKKQRREHRQRNPTLSQSGGLPPVKTDNSLPPI